MTTNMALVLLLSISVVSLGILFFALAACKRESDRTSVAAATKQSFLEQELKKLKTSAEAIQKENQRLSKWQIVDDADAKAREIAGIAESTLIAAKAEGDAIRAKALSDAHAALSDARNESATLVLDARREAEELVSVARDQAKETTASARERAQKIEVESDALFKSANAQSARIVEEAQKRAQEIAGSAYEAMTNAQQYEKAARAMRNIIEGYGDRYVIPAHSFLDELASGYGHVEAGRELKNARERTRSMVESGGAATCEYVEDNRRETAIRFVVDAFNGKVDSVLSRAKDDNIGTLQQEIRDAFTLVNQNGKAFREARITDEYLAARMEELKWAVVLHQLRLEEREEQRRIREQIREEEKVRKEIERAMKDAAREEDLLKKALERAQQQIEKASEAQKAKYEMQLVELTQKLREAEERNQRALSMAQQTKRGHVYVVSNIGSFGEDVYKVGLTRRLEPLDRIRELGDSSVPFEFDVHAMIFSEDAPALENKLHKHFVENQINKVNHRKEFFRVNLKKIREELEGFGLSAKWTMLAEAKEYRETLAIEKAIADDPAKRLAWINRQLELDPVDSKLLEATEV